MSGVGEAYRLATLQRREGRLSEGESDGRVVAASGHACPPHHTHDHSRREPDVLQIWRLHFLSLNYHPPKFQANRPTIVGVLAHTQLLHTWRGAGAWARPHSRPNIANTTTDVSRI
jgi:hypothetical protein